MPTNKEIIKAFRLFFKGILNPDFTKTKSFKDKNERDLLMYLRFFLFGYFGSELRAEVEVKAPYSYTGWGRVDFEIGNIAVEFAVIKKESDLKENIKEIKKLFKYKGKSILVLFVWNENVFVTKYKIKKVLDSLKDKNSDDRNFYKKNIITPIEVAIFKPKDIENPEIFYQIKRDFEVRQIWKY